RFPTPSRVGDVLRGERQRDYSILTDFLRRRPYAVALSFRSALLSRPSCLCRVSDRFVCVDNMNTGMYMCWIRRGGVPMPATRTKERQPRDVAIRSEERRVGKGCRNQVR